MRLPYPLILILVLQALAALPAWIAPSRAPAGFAVDALLLAALCLLLPRRGAGGARALLALATVLLALAAAADAAMGAALSRELNLSLDWQLLGSVDGLLRGWLGGRAGALLAWLALAAACAAVLLALTTLMRCASAGSSRRFAGPCVALAAGLCGWHALLPRAADLVAPWGSEIAQQWQAAQSTRAQTAAFRAALRPPASAALTDGALLARLGGANVLVAFIESYGTSATDDPRYAGAIRGRLQHWQDALPAAGLHAVSGRLESPVQGGQSWLAQGTLLCGLHLGNELDYRLALASGRSTLAHDFARAGYEPLVVMPGITVKPWPEAHQLGYDRAYASWDMGYAGPAFNWVTMPDQYTWSFLSQVAQREGGARPRFTTVALISSHAPWTPILPVLDGAAVGNGAVFGAYRGSGESPAQLWRDPARVREHYARSLDYALAVAERFSIRELPPDTVLILLGDHQPAALVTGNAAPRSVPIHVLAADPALLQPFLDWDFVPGLLPDTARPHPMEAFRDWFVQAYSETHGSQPSRIATSR